MFVRDEAFTLSITVPSRSHAYRVSCSLRAQQQVSDAEVDLLDSVLTGLLAERERIPAASNDNPGRTRLPRQG